LQTVVQELPSFESMRKFHSLLASTSQPGPASTPHADLPSVKQQKSFRDFLGLVQTKKGQKVAKVTRPIAMSFFRQDEFIFALQDKQDDKMTRQTRAINPN
jgi:hypothetical protein